LLRKEGLNFNVKVQDLQSMLEPMWAELDARRNAKGGLVFDINNFNTLEDIYEWLQTTANNCPQAISCQVYSVGNSHEGRPILIFHISRPVAGRKAYWIDATIHAREWIATATALKLIDHFAMRRDGTAVRLTDTYDWYFMPVLNPDGYAWTHASDRLWRKNRRPNTGSPCAGTDLNRNFDYNWGHDGVSHLPCGETYCGPNAASEPETVVVQNEMKRVGPTLEALITMHSYGNLWMFPWGNTVNFAGQTCERTSDHAELMRVANAAANAVQATYNTNWQRGNSCEVIYATTGGTTDYAKAVCGVKYSYVPELRGNNFVIAPANIEPSFREIYAGVIATESAISNQS